MFNKQLSGINKRMPNAAAKSMEIDDDSDKLHLTEAGRLSGFKLYHPERHVKLKIFTAICVVCGCIGAAFVAGATWASAEVGASQNAAEAKTIKAIRSSGSSGDFDDDVGYGGFCWKCSENSGTRGWSWWFGWGACPCHDGWKGACCDISMAAVDGSFGAWGAVGDCDAECGYGQATKTRQCDNPAPKNGGKPCLGAFTEAETCYLGPCADGGPLYSLADLIEAESSVFSANVKFTVNDLWEKGICYIMESSDKISAAFYNSIGSSVMYEGVNFVRGFKWWGLGSVGDSFAGDKWKEAVTNEEINIVPYTAVTGFNYGYDFMNDFFTAEKSPSWEDDEGHDFAIGMLTSSLENADTTCLTHGLEPRFPFDHDLLMKAAWDGFTWFDYHELKYASNGDFGYHLVNQRAAEHGDTMDTLGLLMTETVFSVHLTYDSAKEEFELDLTDMEPYDPLPGYAAMGGKATFVFDNTYGKYGRLRTTSITYGGVTYTEADFAEDAKITNADGIEETVKEAEADSRWIGWRFAEKCIMSSLLGQTNLILHVKGLHLELAAAFQGVTISAFKSNVQHPLRRLLDQFTHRSVQATNGNFDLLFEHKAAEFSLAPLDYNQQLKMIDWYIKNKPLSMATLSMDKFAEERNMDQFSEKPADDANGRPSKFFWRWHYRAAKAQAMYVDMIECWVDANYAGDWNAVVNDAMIADWWAKMKQYLPSMQEAVDQHSEWISGGELTRESLTSVVSTIMTWVSHIHEDVGHSAAYVVYNPVHTPMMVPADGIGVPLNSFAFNTNAYRTFVFLERAKLLDDPADFWFSGAADRQCYTTMQDTYRAFGETDDAFSECGTTGFYSCVDAVETSVSS
ncbi:hypothetical protein TrVE_jg9331 [Triparma verrucosa]|uniref:Lipoxygenase domain-containing protein n=1 Tax=Triparma verrucosa TaxID=1606542 RepID=A0A9W7KWV9_9STRA|nr:hypothetical protein TrVE_jg9331 [Triparma verrucosa]